MEFHLLRVNPGKLLALILVGGVGGLLAAYGLLLLDKYSSFMAAGVATGLFFGGGWLFSRRLNATQEPICVSVSATELVEVNELSGQQRRWSFAEIAAYQFRPEVRGISTLQLTLRSGHRAQLSASNLSLTCADSRAQFGLLRQAFEAAWHQYKQARPPSAGRSRLL